jgi:hypothetical protein
VSRLAALLAGLAVTALVLGLMLQAANGSLPPLTDESWLLVPLGVGLPIVGAAIVRHPGPRRSLVMRPMSGSLPDDPAALTMAEAVLTAARPRG